MAKRKIYGKRPSARALLKYVGSMVGYRRNTNRAKVTNDRMYERYSLLNLMYKKMNNKKFTKIIFYSLFFSFFNKKLFHVLKKN